MYSNTFWGFCSFCLLKKAPPERYARRISPYRPAASPRMQRRRRRTWSKTWEKWWFWWFYLCKTRKITKNDGIARFHHQQLVDLWFGNTGNIPNCDFLKVFFRVHLQKIGGYFTHSHGDGCTLVSSTRNHRMVVLWASLAILSLMLPSDPSYPLPLRGTIKNGNHRMPWNATSVQSLAVWLVAIASICSLKLHILTCCLDVECTLSFWLSWTPIMWYSQSETVRHSHPFTVPSPPFGGYSKPGPPTKGFWHWVSSSQHISRTPMKWWLGKAHILPEHHLDQRSMAFLGDSSESPSILQNFRD